MTKLATTTTVSISTSTDAVQTQSIETETEVRLVLLPSQQQHHHHLHHQSSKTMNPCTSTSTTTTSCVHCSSSSNPLCPPSKPPRIKLKAPNTLAPLPCIPENVIDTSTAAYPFAESPLCDPTMIAEFINSEFYIDESLPSSLTDDIIDGCGESTESSSDIVAATDGRPIDSIVMLLQVRPTINKQKPPSPSSYFVLFAMRELYFCLLRAVTSEDPVNAARII